MKSITPEKVQNAEDQKKGVVTAAQVEKQYKAPKIITHSAGDLDKGQLRVNACTSYIP